MAQNFIIGLISYDESHDHNSKILHFLGIKCEIHQFDEKNGSVHKLKTMTSSILNGSKYCTIEIEISH